MKRIKKRIELSLNESLRIEELLHESDLDLSSQNLLREFEYYLSKHYYQFGSRPFFIEFQPNKGYMLRASSLIGKISTDNFEITLNPKFKDLHFGKCLAMAQYSNSGLLNISSNELTKGLITSKYEYSTADYLGFGLIDAVTSIINNGIARTFKEVINESVKIKGSISLIESIVSGKGLVNPYINESEAEYNITPNRIIKTALQVIIATSRNADLKATANTLIKYFETVSSIDKLDLIIEEFKHVFNLPRVDYEKAIIYATSIIEGGGISDIGKELNMPSITLDLDVVFENFISFKLKELLNKTRFEIFIQKDFKHISTPELNNKKIIPDIVIKDIKFNKLYIIDTKNKYTEIESNGVSNLSNQDIFQLCYYCKTFDTSEAILLFPSTKPKFQFPVKSSESDAAFRTKCETAFEKFRNTQQFKLFKKEQISILIYHIDLSGSMYDTEKSLASFCQLIIHLSENAK